MEVLGLTKRATKSGDSYHSPVGQAASEAMPGLAGPGDPGSSGCVRTGEMLPFDPWSPTGRPELEARQRFSGGAENGRRKPASRN